MATSDKKTKPKNAKKKLSKDATIVARAKNRAKKKSLITKGTLTPARRAIINEYVKDHDSKAACLRAGCKSKNPSAHVSTILSIESCRKYYDGLLNAITEKVVVTQADVMQLWVDIAYSDTNEITQHRLEACRYCYGANHNYHWRNEDEFNAAVDREATEAIKNDRPPKAIDDSGGYGFNPSLNPHALCPSCSGEGKARVYVADTRNLKGINKMRYDGVEMTKNGIKINTLSKEKAIENIAKYLGMFKNTVDLDINEESSLGKLLTEISGSTLKPPSSK